MEHIAPLRPDSKMEHIAPLRPDSKMEYIALVEHQAGAATGYICPSGHQLPVEGHLHEACRTGAMYKSQQHPRI